MELTPLVTAGRQIVERYGASGFRISGTIHPGPVLVFPDRTIAWDIPMAAADAAELSPTSLAPVIEHGGTELLLIGLGRRMVPVPAALRSAMRAAGIAVEGMDTGAACRTYNVLLGEDRRVAAALMLAA